MSQKQKQTLEDRLRVTKVIGGPGTGKTTAVVGNPELEIDGLFLQHMDEYSLKEQLLVTYTKGAVEEAKDRLKAMTGIPKKDLDDYVRTIHSHAYHKIGVENGQLIRHGFKKSFCDKHGLEFEHDDDTQDLVSLGSDTSEGNVLFRINDWLKAYRLGPDDHAQCPVSWDGRQDIEVLLKDWEDYKNQHDKLEFADMIEGVVSECVSVLREGGYGETDIEGDREYLRSCREDPDLNPEAVRNHPMFIDEPVMYVDEAQDLTYLMWDWYLANKLACEKVFLGGDDDQSVYGWAGAEPEDQLLAEEGEVEVLETTYRIPEQVWAACDACIQQVDERQEKDIEPAGDDGEFIALSGGYGGVNPYDVTEHLLETDDAMLLFRAKYHILEFSKELNHLGIPYKHESLPFQTWSRDLLNVREALTTLADGETISADQLITLTDLAPDVLLDVNQPGLVEYTITGNEYGPTAAAEFFDHGLRDITGGQFALWYANAACGWNDRDDPDEEQYELNGYQGTALRENIRRNLTDRDPESVRIMTIHKAKGKEADTVVLGTDSTTTILANMDVEHDGDDSTDRAIFRRLGDVVDDKERRVMYVGMSRAKRKLVMAEGLVTPDTTLHINALVHGDD